MLDEAVQKVKWSALKMQWSLKAMQMFTNMQHNISYLKCTALRNALMCFFMVILGTAKNTGWGKGQGSAIVIIAFF